VQRTGAQKYLLCDTGIIPDKTEPANNANINNTNETYYLNPLAKIKQFVKLFNVLI